MVPGDDGGSAPLAIPVNPRIGDEAAVHLMAQPYAQHEAARFFFVPWALKR